VPRCWSGGNSNRRSSLPPYIQWKVRRTKFQPGCFQQPREISPMIHRRGRGENERISERLPLAKDPKETASSNPLRSSNEALRTVRADRWQARIRRSSHSPARNRECAQEWRATGGGSVAPHHLSFGSGGPTTPLSWAFKRLTTKGTPCWNHRRGGATFSAE
jgi:hypothetical protein